MKNDANIRNFIEITRRAHGKTTENSRKRPKTGFPLF